MARLLIGVSGGIAAYKALEAARLAVTRGHAVRVIQTATSKRFVGGASFAAITGAPVLTGEFEPDPARGAYPGEPLPEHMPISHLAIVDRAEVFLIAPASANTIAKLAGGHADNLLSSAALAAGCPLLVAPAMNHRMYLHPATQANLARLRERGITVMPPGEGRLASHGEHGVGRLPEPAELIDACEQVLAAGSGGPAGPAGRDLIGLRVLVTAGGTREPIDSVRYIGNRSSGRMGVALAARAAARGAQVVLIGANLAIRPPGTVRLVAVETAAEMAAACEAEFARTDVVLMAAAVADFRPAAPVERKIKKDAGTPPPVVLVPTTDVIATLAARRRPGQTLVGFAAEHGADAVALGRAKRERKGLDAVVVNDIARRDIGFDATDNEVTVVTAGEERRLSRAPKERIADAIIDQVLALRVPGPPPDGVDGTAHAPGGSPVPA